MRTRLLVVALLLGSCAALYACGSSDNSLFGNGGDDAGDEAAAVDDGGPRLGGGDGGPMCSPACTSAQLCSVTSKCIPKGTCVANGDCTDGTVCDNGDSGTNTCVPGGNCGATKVAAQIVPPNLLVTLDRSCSMTEKVNLADGGTATKWEVAVSAIDTLTTDYKDKIRFGLILFPDLSGNKCAQDDFPFPVGPGHELGIQTMLNAARFPDAGLFPNGPCVTNIDTALEQAATDPGLADKTRGDFVLLVTDGQQAGCNLGGGAAGAIHAVHDLYVEAGVPTFAVGFGSGADPVFLGAVAVEGGTAPQDAGASQFYLATDQAALTAAFQDIAQKAIGCVFKLGTAPPDPSKLYVFVNGTVRVAKDSTHATGWDYDSASNTVTFYGAMCSDLKAGKVSGVDIEYGCPQPGTK